MRIFLIGGGGYIGAAVLERLVRDGHAVAALTRSEGSAVLLKHRGASPVPGDLADVECLAEQCAQADAVIQIALGGFLTEMVGEGGLRLTRAVTTILDATAPHGKPFLFTSGAGIYGDTGIVDPARIVDETDRPAPPYFYGAIDGIEQSIIAAHARGAHAVVLRPGQVYGRGGGYIGPVARRFEAARKLGRVQIVESVNRVSYVHVDDLADAFMLALDARPPSGVYNLANDTVEPRPVAEAVSAVAGFGGVVTVVTEPEIRASEGWPSALDFRWSLAVSCDRAKRELNWAPARQGVVEEILSLNGKVGIDNIYPAPRYESARVAVLPIAD